MSDKKNSIALLITLLLLFAAVAGWASAPRETADGYERVADFGIVPNGATAPGPDLNYSEFRFHLNTSGAAYLVDDRTDSILSLVVDSNGVRIRLPEPAWMVVLNLGTYNVQAIVSLYDKDGALIRNEFVPQLNAFDELIYTVDADEIAMVEIVGGGNEFHLQSILAYSRRLPAAP
jgi:hypothetical protein